MINLFIALCDANADSKIELSEIIDILSKLDNQQLTGIKVLEKIT